MPTQEQQLQLIIDYLIKIDQTTIEIWNSLLANPGNATTKDSISQIRSELQQLRNQLALR